MRGGTGEARGEDENKQADGEKKREEEEWGGGGEE